MIGSKLPYRVIRWIVKLVSPKYTFAGLEKLPEEPFVIVGNHSQIYGPIASELYAPGQHYTWCIGEMMNRKEVAEYAFHDFWEQKPGSVRWIFWLFSRMIGPLAEYIFTSADTIAVYHDSRLIRTYRESIDRLREGSNIVIFPESHVRHNGIVYEFQDKFVDLARFYHKKTGKELSFVPLYLAPRLKTMSYGTPVRFDASAPIDEERSRICRALMDEITCIARAQPEHIVVPYENIPKKQYPKNTDQP